MNRTPTQAARAARIAADAKRANIRAKVRLVLAKAEHLALDNARDRAQLERMLVEELTK